MVKVERGEASAGLYAIVVSKLSSNEMFIPIRLMRSYISSEHVFNRAVGTFCLAVCLRVMRCGHVEFGAKAFA